MRSRAGRSFVAALVIAVGLFAPAMPFAHAGAAYTVQLDAKPPKGEPWAFLRFFPSVLAVHQGDVIQAAWAGNDAPHTATMVPSADANAWRSTNQGPPGPQDPATFPYALQVPDTTVGGDDATDVVLNPAVAGPSDFTCGTQAAPCGFDGTGVVSSGFQVSNPASQPSFFVQVNAPVGTYSFLCLLHPGMQETVNVEPSATTILTPSEVATVITNHVRKATNVYAEAADAQAQQVKRTNIGHGHRRYTINAGGFSNNVSADEFVNSGLQIHVGDQVKVMGNYEIHTLTSPKSSFKTVPFVETVCEVTGPDTPAVSPADCTSPDKFQVMFNGQALMPTASNRLKNPSTFVNSGLLGYGQSFTFDAAKAGVYRMVCLVHGPMMHLTVNVEK
jgi:plastocyanin